MENKDTFKMTYSAEEQEEINQIRKKYEPQEPDKIEQLRTLDANAEKKAVVPAIIIGVIGTLVMGTGMSIIMSEFGAIFGAYALIIGIVLGVIGIILVALAYPVYNHTLKQERERIAPEIIRLTDELLK